ncbi:BTB/POZ domain-containing protein [Camellia lanceoleosa]|uniref:BTB/POZ domain-containing protein n=1 Tax=Camellia lanceoleosa TaxID=1840588 RepID=A0ACC0FGR8_9ERIC|nr:BTB/POZ domain-containing protein [Camellia lanceoleosa]
MFTNGMSESISSKVLLQDVPLEAFKAMLEFMYYGELNKEDTMDIDTLLLQLLLLADQFGVTLLHQECCKTLLECLSEHPDLTVTSEERVLNAILLWCMQAKEFYVWDVVDEMILNSAPELFGERFQSINYLLPLLRFPLLPYALLKKLERSDLSRMIPTFDFLVISLYSARFQHKRSSFTELQYICDGDNNGVLYFIGTSFGEQQWVNPVLAKRICVSASSPISRDTDPKVLVSRTYQEHPLPGLGLKMERIARGGLLTLAKN